MPLRSQSNLEFLLFLPWWVSAGIGVLLYVLLRALQHHLATTGGPMGEGLAKAIGILPVAALVFFSFVALLAAFARWKWSDRLENQRSIESIRSLTWQQFESLVTEAYRRKGYTVEQSLAGGADGGVDLVLRKDGETTLVQCKQWRSLSVGAPVIREQYGLLMHEQAHHSIVVTSGNFTREAEAFVRGKPMTLVDGTQLLQLVREVQKNRPAVAAATPATGAACPLCGSPMVLRTAKRGPRAGNQFWGCATYPACKGTRKA